MKKANWLICQMIEKGRMKDEILIPQDFENGKYTGSIQNVINNLIRHSDKAFHISSGVLNDQIIFMSLALYEQVKEHYYKAEFAGVNHAVQMTYHSDTRDMFVMGIPVVPVLMSDELMTTYFVSVTLESNVFFSKEYMIDANYILGASVSFINN